MGLRGSITLVAAVCLIGTTSQTASAAPQVLAMMTSGQPIPLACNDSECSALVGHILPAAGSGHSGSMDNPTRPTCPNASSSVAASMPAAPCGRSRPPGADLHFSGYSGYTMVRVSLPRAELDRLGGTAVAMQIDPGISLVPLARTGDRNPQTPERSPLATGPMRIAASPYIDQPTVSADAARLVAALVNGLPESRTIHDDYVGAWDRMVGIGSRQKSDPAVLRQAERAYPTCVQSDFNSLRQCLLSQHQRDAGPRKSQVLGRQRGY